METKYFVLRQIRFGLKKGQIVVGLSMTKGVDLPGWARISKEEYYYLVEKEKLAGNRAAIK